MEQTEINIVHFELSVNKDISIMTFNNHRNLSKQSHTWQEEDYNHRVDNWEPVNLDITHSKVCVPSRCPLHLTRLHRGKTRLSSSSLPLFNIHCNWIFENNKNSLDCVDCVEKMFIPGMQRPLDKIKNQEHIFIFSQSRNKCTFSRKASEITEKWSDCWSDV